MASSAPRLRMFAGPNGSGKSTIKEVVRPSIRGTYINPDDLARALTSNRGQSFDEFGLGFDLNEFRAFIEDSDFLRAHQTPELAAKMELQGNVAFYPSHAGVGYLASALSDYLRRKMMAENRWFSFETVMSSRDKVELLETAQAQGYRTYLYYIATDDVRINIARVAARVLFEGHDVPEDKIRARYLRSLELLKEAIAYSTRAYLFDNSSDGTKPLWVGEVKEDGELVLQTQDVPFWVKKYVIDPMGGEEL